MRVALYARVSTRDQGQDPETQLHALRQWAAQQGHEVVREYVDLASAGDLRGRVEWRRLLEDARRGGWDALAVVRLDRAWRSAKAMHDDLDYLDRHGKGFVSITQPIDTTASTGRLLLSILGAIAEFERDIIRERILEGLAKARATGRRLGRPPGSKDRRKRRRSGYYARFAD